MTVLIITPSVMKNKCCVFFFTFLIAEVATLAVAVTMEMRTVRFASREQSSWRTGLMF